MFRIEGISHDCNQVLQATVAVIGALTRNHCKYIACPFLISATCKSEDAHTHVDLLSLAWKACKMKGSVYCITSDGKSRCGKVLIALTEHTPLSPTSPLFAHLSRLPLLNLMVGEDELTLDKHYKHI